MTMLWNSWRLNTVLLWTKHVPAVICWMKAMRLYVGVNCVWSVKLKP